MIDALLVRVSQLISRCSVLLAGRQIELYYDGYMRGLLCSQRARVRQRMVSSPNWLILSRCEMGMYGPHRERGWDFAFPIPGKRQLALLNMCSGRDGARAHAAKLQLLSAFVESI